MHRATPYDPSVGDGRRLMWRVTVAGGVREIATAVVSTQIPIADSQQVSWMTQRAREK